MNFGDKAKQVISAIAPMLGTAIGGPFGALAGTVLSTALGTSDPKAIETALLSGDPATLAKLKQADMDFQEHMRALDIQEKQLAYADTDSARKREMAVKDWIPGMLAIIVTTGFLGMLAFLLLVGKPPSGGDVLMVSVGTLGGVFASVISYYFGSSAGSAAKNSIIDKFTSRQSS